MTLDIQSIPKLVISLPNREDRRAMLSTELSKLFFNPSYELIDGVVMNPSEKGIVQAHKNALSYAQSKGWHYVLIMEDDLKLSDSPGLINYVAEAFNSLPDDFGALSGACYCGRPQQYNLYWSKIKNFCGMQFVLYSSSVYEKIINHDYQKSNFDRETSNIIPFYVINKLFASEHPGRSDHAKKDVDYDHILKKYQLLV